MLPFGSNLIYNVKEILRQISIEKLLRSSLTNVCIVGKGGFGNTKFIAFEKQAWHYECFICGLCNVSMVGKGFIQDESDIICPECARKKMLEEMEAEYQEA